MKTGLFKAILLLIIFLSNQNVIGQTDSIADTNQLKTSKVYLIDEITTGPGIKTTDNWDLSSPLIQHSFGIGINPFKFWHIDQSFNLYIFGNSWSGALQTQYFVGNSFRLNDKLSLKFNMHFAKIKGNLRFFDYNSTSDTTHFNNNQGTQIEKITETNDTINYYGDINERINIYYFSILYKHKRIESELSAGLYNNLSVSNGGFATKTGGFVRETNTSTNNFSQTPINTLDSTDFDSTFIQNFTQIGLNVKYTFPFFKDAIISNTALKLPFNKQKVGFTASQDVRFRFTSNTWLGGIAQYSTGFNPIEDNAAWILQGTDAINLRYGGYIVYEPTRYWSVDVKLIRENRTDNYTKKQVKQLGLLANFHVYIR